MDPVYLHQMSKHKSCQTQTMASHQKHKSNNNEKYAYASIFGEGEDEVSQERNKILLQQELVIHPKSNLTALICCTFPTRRQWILNDTIPRKEIISEYPHLVHVSNKT